jgi:hypothetical protein
MSRARLRLDDLLKLVMLANLVVVGQVVLSAVLFAFPFITFLVAVRCLQIVGNLLWPGGFDGIGE